MSVFNFTHIHFVILKNKSIYTWFEFVETFSAIWENMKTWNVCQKKATIIKFFSKMIKKTQNLVFRNLPWNGFVAAVLFKYVNRPDQIRINGLNSRYSNIWSAENWCFYSRRTYQIISLNRLSIVWFLFFCLIRIDLCLSIVHLLF